MRLLEAEESLDVARRIVAASPAEETEVTVDTAVDRFVRYADVGVTQNADRDRLEVGIRVRFAGSGGWREARATTGSLDEEATRKALERAVALARQSPTNTQAVELGGPGEVASNARGRPTMEHDFAGKAEWVRTAVAACAQEDLKPAGILRTTGLSRAIASSAGRAVHGWFSRASMSLTASGQSGSGFGEEIASSVAELDPGRLIARAVDKARRSQDPSRLEPGEYTVVLEPNAVSAILLFASYQGFGAREVDEQSSFLCGRTGERAFAEALTIVDDASNEVYPGLPFDGEGTPKRVVPLVERGVLTGPVTDRAYARKLGLECTGHAQPQPDAHGPLATNLVVAAGDQSIEELIAGVDRGLLVTQFHYTNMIEPRDLTLTGMTRNGTFLIENGEVKGAVKNLRFTETLVKALSSVSGVGREREIAGALFDGEIVAPALRIDGFRFTSTTDF
ncbi:MAG: TldD/PmbA family protein [Planctomycetota bacterium]|nr:TldD/PmbA family protein [Planctomycetota bacterium]